MHAWEYLCFDCEVEPLRNGKFFCSTSNSGCKIKQGVDSGEIPEKALRVGSAIMKQDSVGFNDAPLWTQKDRMSNFCADVKKVPESQIRWNE